MIAVATEAPGMPNPQLVTAGTVGKLNELVVDADRIALDTEFMRERTYFPQLCLVQVATPAGICCVDPLEMPDIDRVWQTLLPRTWVVHSGRQDIEVVYQSAGRMPAGLFDTQIAAGLLGFPPQLGYAALVAELFGVELAKLHTRADWSRRPIRPELLEYAAEDVEHLLPAAEVLAERLVECGRLDWAIADSGDLLDETLYTPEPESAVRRLKGARRLSGRAGARARRLAAWREREALRRDRPRQWILGDAVLLELAVSAPADAAALARISGLPAGTARRAGDQLLAAVAAAVDEPVEAPPPRPDERYRSRLAAMQSLVAARAGELGIVPEVVVSKKDLSAALMGERNLRVLKGWRRGVVGEELLGMLETAD